MKKKILKGLGIYSVIFAVIFILRLIYGFASYPHGRPHSYSPFTESFSYTSRNYASSKIVFRKKGYEAKSPVKDYKAKPSVTVDQKYEKIADIVSQTSHFKKDEDQCRSTIKKYNALVQYEGRTGLKGNRRLNLAIGVRPELFDDMVKDISKIGRITSSSINKTDKTNEYKDLNAKKNSLIKIRNSLIHLKSRNGKIAEYIQLDNRILEIEKELQDLGVKLGEYDSENEFCTVKFSLNEGKKYSGISLSHRLKVALQWTFFFQMGATFLLILGMIALFIMLIVIDKAKVIQKIYESTRDRT